MHDLTSLCPLSCAVCCLLCALCPVLSYVCLPAVLSCFAVTRGYLFLGGYLSSAISAMLMMRLGSWIFGYGRVMFNMEL